MGLLDTFTGGKSGDAEDALKQAGDVYQRVQVPTVDQLRLPDLQRFVQAGIMTPAEAQAYLQQSNAYETENTPQTGTSAMIDALNELSGISDAGPMGTPEEQAQVGSVIDQMNQTVGGQRGAIEQNMAAKGTPAAMIQAVLQNQYVGQDAQQAHRNALQAQSAAYQQAVQALADKGNLGGALQGQQNAQANTVANAANAMQQFNARNQQDASQLNAGLKQQAGLYNAQAAQNASDSNVKTGNARTTYNAQLPQTVFQDSMQKASGIAGVNKDQSSLAQEQGKQEAGIWSGLIGAGANMGGDYMTANAMNKALPAAAATAADDPAMLAMVAKGGVLSHDGCYHEGGICMDDGGMVPGQAEVPGDSLENDTVHVMASPGEAVIPRSAVQNHMPEVLSMISEARGDEQPAPQVDPQDVATLLQALRAIRTGAA